MSTLSAQSASVAPRLTVPRWIAGVGIVAMPAVIGGFFGARQVKGVAAAALLLMATVAAVSTSAGVALVAFLAPMDAYVRPLVVYKDLLITDAIILAFIGGRAWMSTAVPRASDAKSGCVLLLLFLALHIVSVSPGNWADAVDNVARLAFFAALVWTLAGCGLTAGAATAAAVGLSVATLARMAQEAVPYARGFIFDPSYQFGALTSNPNTLGGFAAAVVPIGAAMAVFHPSARSRLVGLALSAAMAGGIVLTFSKSAWVATAAGLLIVGAHVLLRDLRPSRRVLMLALAAVVAAMMIPRARALPLMMVSRWTSYGSELSNMERLRYIDVSGRLILRQPLFGVGLERYGPAFKEETGAPLGPEDPHNGYLMVATELGLPALGCFFLFAAIVVLGAWRRAREAAADDAHLRVGLSASTVAVLVFQLFSAEPLTARLTWVLFGLALSSGLPAKREVAT
ncbi:MAG TPA: O-antigen ligase family protein [Vicinamibacterales bacterium]|nr:O-antigen ligase family protein [Vicinamibacterales bacterium]